MKKRFVITIEITSPTCRWDEIEAFANGCEELLRDGSFPVSRGVVQAEITSIQEVGLQQVVKPLKEKKTEKRKRKKSSTRLSTLYKKEDQKQREHDMKKERKN